MQWAGFTLQYTCIDKNEARFKRSISYELILTLMGKLLFLFTWKANVEG